MSFNLSVGSVVTVCQLQRMTDSRCHPLCQWERSRSAPLDGGCACCWVYRWRTPRRMWITCEWMSFSTWWGNSWAIFAPKVHCKYLSHAHGTYIFMTVFLFRTQVRASLNALQRVPFFSECAKSSICVSSTTRTAAPGVKV